LSRPPLRGAAGFRKSEKASSEAKSLRKKREKSLPRTKGQEKKNLLFLERGANHQETTLILPRFGRQ